MQRRWKNTMQHCNNIMTHRPITLTQCNRWLFYCIRFERWNTSSLVMQNWKNHETQMWYHAVNCQLQAAVFQFQFSSESHQIVEIIYLMTAAEETVIWKGTEFMRVQPLLIFQEPILVSSYIFFGWRVVIRFSIDKPVLCRLSQSYTDWV